MTRSSKEPRLVDNLRAAENAILERIRGPALALLSKVRTGWSSVTAQPVIKIRAPNGQTITAGPTPESPVLHWGTGGFELSACIDEGDRGLAMPLESDHANFFATGQISDPATPRVHDRGLAVTLPFSYLKVAEALPGELYLGKKGRSIYMRMDRDGLALELEAAGVSASIRFGKNASRGVARKDDIVTISGAFMTYLTNLSAAIPFAAPVPGIAVGTINTASSKVVTE